MSAKTARHEPEKAKGGFWTSPWPYIIGGAVVLAGTAVPRITSASFSPDNVNVSAARVSLGTR
jgi:hypothetical protein